MIFYGHAKTYIVWISRYLKKWSYLRYCVPWLYISYHFTLSVMYWYRNSCHNLIKSFRRIKNFAQLFFNWHQTIAAKNVEINFVLRDKKYIKKLCNIFFTTTRDDQPHVFILNHDINFVANSPLLYYLVSISLKIFSIEMQIHLRNFAKAVA